MAKREPGSKKLEREKLIKKDEESLKRREMNLKAIRKMFGTKENDDT